MTQRKANPQRPGRKPGVRIPCGACFAMLTAAEWKGHHLRCPDRLIPRVHKLLDRDWLVFKSVATDLCAVFCETSLKRIGPWCETRIEAVAQCPMEPGKKN